MEGMQVKNKKEKQKNRLEKEILVMRKKPLKAMVIMLSMIFYVMLSAGNGMKVKAAGTTHLLSDIIDKKTQALEVGDIVENDLDVQTYDGYVFRYYTSFVNFDELNTNFIYMDFLMSQGETFTVSSALGSDVSKLSIVGMKVLGNSIYFSLEPYSEKTVESTAASAGVACAHTCEWITETEASEIFDGVMAYECTKCGAITDYMAGGTGSASAYAVFNKNTVTKVNQAKAGETVQINTQIWTSFSKEVMKAIAARRDINIELTYRLAGQTWQIRIPAEAAVPADVDFAGFSGYLAGLYGKNQQEK